MECPVCGNKKISPFATHCSKCDADIVAFPLLEDLEEQSIAILKDKVSLEGELVALEQLRRQDKARYRKKLNRAYWFLFLLPLMLFICGKRDVVKVDTQITQELENQNKPLQEISSDNNSGKQPNNTSDNITPPPSNTPNMPDTTSQTAIIPEKVFHIVKQGDNLYTLAKKYLHDETQWEKLSELNPHITNYKKMMPGDTVLIKLR